jgi:tetratricopeptide (TPR) repeat protein
LPQLASFVNLTRVRTSSISLLLFSILISFLLGATGHAEHLTKEFIIRYASNQWNKNSKILDTAFIYLRDKISSQVIKVQLEETEPDSGFFSGQFSLRLSSNQLPDVEVFESPTKFNQSKPNFFREEKNKTVIEVYDTADQASRAKEAYGKQLEEKSLSEKQTLVKPVPDESSLDVAKTAEMKKMSDEASTRDADRIRLEQIEKQKMEQMKNKQDKLSKKIKLERKSKAQLIAEQAKDLYSKNEFAAALPLFKEATELDPSNREIYFMYGVCLYRVERFDDALVTLRIAQTNPETEIEKQYYMGLIHYRLKELDLARTSFTLVKNSGRPVLAPSAAFYIGLIYFTEENLEAAQAEFEYVVDKSEDPALDKKADEFIEQIANAIQFKKLAAKKIFVNVSLGATYDSNILFVADNDKSTGQASRNGGVRNNFSGDGEYRLFYKPLSDMSLKGAVTTTRSISTDFVKADATVATFSAPYSLKTAASKWTVTPGAETIFLDFDESGHVSNILNTEMVNLDYMKVMSETWFSSSNLDVRRDDSRIPDLADNNADAVKFGLKKTEMILIDSEKKKALIGSLGYVLNEAQGDEKTYHRVEFNGIYSAPWNRFKNTTWNAGLSIYKQLYTKSNANRKDTDTAFMFGTSTAINEHWKWSTNANYTSNISNGKDFTYNKYTVLATLTYSWDK